jgi:hydroxymethylpyrimidine pyrophosphatase-like HAD family hydrolase
MRHAFVVDIDNTLTPPRRPLEADMAQVLKDLSSPFHVAAGSDLRIVKSQFFEPLFESGFRGEFESFLCNGASHFHCDFRTEMSIEVIREFSIADFLGQQNFSHLLDVINKTLVDENFRLPEPMRVIGDLITDRGSMINVAPIGRPTIDLDNDAFENREFFEAYDKKTNYRSEFMSHIRSELSDLMAEKNLVISYGGQTSFDFNIKGNDKSFAVVTLLDDGYTDLVYVGDALFEGGNDGVILNFKAEWEDNKARWPHLDQCPVTPVRVDSHKDTPSVLCAHQQMQILRAKETDQPAKSASSGR